MDLAYSPAEAAFDAEVRAFVAAALPRRISEKVRGGKTVSRADYLEWQEILSRKGWLAGDWPVAHGGCGWSPIERHIFEEACAEAYAPPLIAFGVHMLGPVLIAFGTDAQRARFLPRILSGEDWWCQGYSEPGAGSDLASLRTKATRDGDGYVLNGQKTWTTYAQHANRMFLLARTRSDGKPQEGISFFLIDMDQPGVEVRPIRTLDGGVEINEVWLTDVRAPAENLVGAENQGWTIAKHLLNHERINLANFGLAKALLAKLVALAEGARRAGRALLDDPAFAARLARVEIDIDAMRVTNLRLLSAAASNDPAQAAQLGPMASMLKIKATTVRQELNDLSRRAVGPQAVPFVSEALEEGWNGETFGPPDANALASIAFNDRKISIYGGSNEIQRNIIAKSVGL